MMHSIFDRQPKKEPRSKRNIIKGKWFQLTQRDIVNPHNPSSADVNCPRDHTCPMFITAPLLTLNICWPLNTASCSAQPLPVVTSGLELRQQLASLASAQAQCYCQALAQYLALASLKFAGTKRDIWTKGLTAC